MEPENNSNIVPFVTPDDATPLQPVQPSASDASQPGAPAAPAAQAPQQSGFLHSFSNAVASVLGGGDAVTLTRGADGKMVVEKRPKTASEVWGSLAKSALTGMGAGMSVAPGPGAIQRAAGASIGAGINMAQQNHQKQVDAADSDQDHQEKAVLHKAQVALLNQELSSNAFDSAHKKVMAMDQSAQTENEISQILQSNPNNRDMGVAKNPSEIRQILAGDPDALAHQANGRIYGRAHVNEKGEYDGMHYYYADPDWQSQRNAAPVQMKKLIPSAKVGEPATVGFETIPAGAMTNGEIMKAQMVRDQNIIDYSATQHEQKNKDVESTSKVKLQGAQTSEAYASADKSRAEGAKLRTEAAQLAPSADGLGTSKEQNAAMMVEGHVAPSQLSKRGKEYNDLVPLANAYSMKKYGQPFDAEISEGRYQQRKQTLEAYGAGKQGDQIQTFNTFLAHAKDLSDVANKLRNTNVPLLNTPLNKLRQMATGNSQISAILPQIEAVRTEYQNFVNNNHALHESDINEGHELLNENQTLAQMQGAIKSFAHIGSRRVGALNDRYKRVIGTDVPDLLTETGEQSLRGFGMGDTVDNLRKSGNQLRPTMTSSAAPQAAAPQVAPAGATAEVHDPKTGALIGHMVGSNYVSLGGK